MKTTLLLIQGYSGDYHCKFEPPHAKAGSGNPTGSLRSFVHTNAELFILSVFVLMISFMFVIPVHAESLMKEIQQSGKQMKPIDITSSQLEANLKSHTVIFKGNVVAKQGDVVLYCDTLTAYYDAKDKNITMIVATGDVKITKKDMIATGDEAVFDNVKKLLTLTGSPRIWQAKNIIEGTKIVFYLGTDRIFVEGAKSLYNPQTEGILNGQTP
jgi:lipopolysaccharide export system protein LptA